MFKTCPLVRDEGYPVISTHVGSFLRCLDESSGRGKLAIRSRSFKARSLHASLASSWQMTSPRVTKSSNFNKHMGNWSKFKFRIDLGALSQGPCPASGDKIFVEATSKRYSSSC